MRKKITEINKFPIFVTLLSIIVLAIFLLSYYPGIVSYDGNNQWQQVQSGIITNSHPFFSTFFMLLLSKIWNSVTIVSIYQIIMFSISWGYLINILRVNGKKKKVITIIYTILVMILPLTSIFTITLWKDILYTTYLFLCALILYEWSDNGFKLNNFKYCLLGIALSMVYSYRHNGIIVAILLILIFYIICIKKYRKKIISKNVFKKSFIVLLSFISLIMIISVPKKIYLDKSEEILKKENHIDYSTIDGYMLWMMGSHIKEGNVKSKKDQEFLNKIIPLQEWKKAYNPYLINYTSNSEYTDKEFLIKNNKKFEKMFIKYSLKNPGTIIEHYIKADALLFDPLASYHGYVYVFCFPEMWSLPDYTVIKPKFTSINKLYGKVVDISLKEPFIFFYEPAIILYLSLILTFFLSKKVYGKKIWLFTLPMILNVVSLLPINLAQDLRYIYVNYITFYGLVLFLILNIKNVFNRKSKLRVD